MAEIVKIRGQYTGESGVFKNNSFYTIKVKQEEWRFKVKEVDNKEAVVVEYKDFDDFAFNWDICTRLK